MATLINDANLKTALAARLKLAGTSNMTTESPHWDQLITELNQQAYDEIRTVLLGRGYTATNIANWDRGEEFNRRIALCMLFEEGAVTDAIDQASIDRVCKCREELLTVEIMVDGAIVEPGSGAVVSYGDVDTTNDRFVRDTEETFEQDW